MGTSELTEPAALPSDLESAGFFAGLGRGVLLARECTNCGHLMIPWLPRCPQCGGLDTAERALSGAGTVYSWVRVWRPLNDTPWDGPFTVVTVELDEGPRVLGRLINVERPQIGAAVDVALDGSAQLRFALRDAA